MIKASPHPTPSHRAPSLQLDLASIYEGLLPGQTVYRLRALACGGAQHAAFVLLPELAAWTMFDEGGRSTIGAWADVRRKCEAARALPVLLFYEAEK